MLLSQVQVKDVTTMPCGASSKRSAEQQPEQERCINPSCQKTAAQEVAATLCGANSKHGDSWAIGLCMPIAPLAIGRIRDAEKFNPSFKKTAAPL